MSDNKSAGMSANVTSITINLSVSIGGGILTHILIALFRRFHMSNPILVTALALAIVIPPLVLFVVKRGGYFYFWVMASAALILAVVFVHLITVRVPNVVEMTLTDAKAAIANADLAFQEIEMVKDGSKKVIIQRPKQGTLLFKDSRVKLFFGQRPTVMITKPESGEILSSHRENIRGVSEGVAGSDEFHVRVLIRSHDNHFWIQESPNLNPDGHFSAFAHFGTPQKGRGETFWVQAIITTEPLKPGDAGLEIPKFIACSPVIEVKRKQ